MTNEIFNYDDGKGLEDLHKDVTAIFLFGRELTNYGWNMQGDISVHMKGTQDSPQYDSLGNEKRYKYDVAAIQHFTKAMDIWKENQFLREFMAAMFGFSQKKEKQVPGQTSLFDEVSREK